MNARRLASLWFPSLAIERWASLHADGPETCPEQRRRAALARPLVLTVEGRHGLLIHAVTPAAAARGARVGARLSDARALDPGLEAEPADIAGEAAWLRAAARWAGRWSPLVAVDGTDGLLLDLGGVTHLFGGEAALLAEMERAFAARGIAARGAVAPTAGAAWALARFSLLGAAEWEGEGSADIPPRAPHPSAAVRLPPSPVPGEGTERLAALLAPLPVAALRLSPLATRTLVRLGLKTIGDLAGVPRRALARRFGKDDHPLDALDRALGRTAEPLIPLVENPPPRTTLPLREPVTHEQAGAQALPLLVPRIAAELAQRHLGARALVLRGYRVDGSVGEVRAATSIPTREAAHLHRLLAGALERQGLDPGFGLDALVLEVTASEPLASAQGGLAGEEAEGPAVAALVDRLSVRLGPDKVRRPVALESHLPERAAGWEVGVESSSLLPREPGGGGSAEPRRRGPGDSGTKSSQSLRDSSPRYPGEQQQEPARLLDRPEEIAVIYATPEGLPRRFVWRRKVHDIARAQGPRRIAPEWWRSPKTARLRDYYKVEDTTGVRFWIFREGVVGDGRGGAPLWFVHGLFA